MIQRTQGSVIGCKDTALMERLRKTYLDYNDAQFEFFERLSSEMFGREIENRK